MEELRIVGWTDFEDEYPTRQYSNEELGYVVSLIKAEIVKNKYRFSGEEHQNSMTGVPVFSDGTCFRASMRCWAQIMAVAYSQLEGKEYSYMDFYMTLDDSKMPSYVPAGVEPAKIEDETYGYIVRQDHELISQSKAFGMPFMTTDKVLQKMQ